MLSPVRLDIDAITADGSPWLLDETLVKKHCRIDDTDQDANLQLYIQAAILWAENSTHRTIIRRSHRWVLREFPYDGYEPIRLPRGKTVSVESITYTASRTGHVLKGPTSDPVSADYQEDLRGEDGGLLMPLQGSCWPSVDYDAVAPVTIAFTAGWAGDEIPGELVNAVLLGISDMYDLRGSSDFANTSLADVGKSLAVREALVSGYRLSRWY